MHRRALSVHLLVICSTHCIVVSRLQVFLPLLLLILFQNAESEFITQRKSWVDATKSSSEEVEPKHLDHFYLWLAPQKLNHKLGSIWHRWLQVFMSGVFLVACSHVHYSISLCCLFKISSDNCGSYIWGLSNCLTRSRVHCGIQDFINLDVLIVFIDGEYGKPTDQTCLGLCRSLLLERLFLIGPFKKIRLFFPSADCSVPRFGFILFSLALSLLFF